MYMTKAHPGTKKLSKIINLKNSLLPDYPPSCCWHPYRWSFPFCFWHLCCCCHPSYCYFPAVADIIAGISASAGIPPAIAYLLFQVLLLFHPVPTDAGVRAVAEILTVVPAVTSNPFVASVPAVASIPAVAAFLLLLVYLQFQPLELLD